MNYLKDIINDIVVLLLIAFPPFLYLFRYICDRFKNNFVRVLIFAAYWICTLWTNNLVPAVTVLFLIWRSKAEAVGMNGEGYRRFNLDCSGRKWRFSLKEFIMVSLLGLLIKGLVTYANLIVIVILQFFKVPLESQAVVNEFLGANIWESLYYFIMISICAPVVEEFVFRFWIYDRILKKRTNIYLAALFTNLLFMAAHFNIQGAFAFFLVGLVNCFLYEKKGYWAAVANHFMFNFSTVIILIVVKALNIPLT